MHAARLRRGEDIARVRRDGLARNDKLFSLRALPTDQATVRLAVASTRAVGGAVRRNRARRRVREALRQALVPRRVDSGVDLLVMARPAALMATAADLRAAADRELAAVLPGSRREPQ